MNPRLKESVETAESVLPQEGQDRLAFLVDSFTANYRQNAQDSFSQAELAELEQIEKSGIKKADSAKVSALFARHGL